MDDFHTRAEQIVDAIRAAHATREQAVGLVATHLRTAHTDGVILGTRTTGEAIHTIFDRVLAAGGAP